MGKTLEKVLKSTLHQQNINRMKYGGKYLKTYLLPDNSITQVCSDVAVAYKEFTPLCVKDNGTFVSPDSFKYCARVIHHELGNVLFHAHCLRHTHGTILAEGGVNPKTVMERWDIRTSKLLCRPILSIQKPCSKRQLKYLNSLCRHKKSGWTFRLVQSVQPLFFIFCSFYFCGWQIGGK